MGSMQFEFSLLLHPLALGILLVLCLGVFGALSAAFLYHWKEYGMNTRIIRSVPVIYFVVSSFLAVLSVISYLALL